MLDDSDAGGAVSSEPNAAAASGGEEAARALNVAVVRVASSKHVRDLRGALAKRGRRGLDAVIGAFARADGDADSEEMVGESDDDDEEVCFYLPLHFKRLLLTILTCPPHILTFKNAL